MKNSTAARKRKSAKVGPLERRRLPPSLQRHHLVEEAFAYFAEAGLSGGTRELAKRVATEIDVVALDPATVSDTLGVLLKYQDDIARLEGSKIKELLDEVKSELRAAK